MIWQPEFTDKTLSRKPGAVQKEERERIYQTSIRPFRKATYTHFPEIDPRLRNYRSRYGAISND
ncbi:phage anti-RecBCD protein [Escherichia albertii]|uniref:phage anti-RecBCD protein n=1 Tax=Escherichia albertii TaxID=208962 RepID=UPI000F622420